MASPLNALQMKASNLCKIQVINKMRSPTKGGAIEPDPYF